MSKKELVLKPTRKHFEIFKKEFNRCIALLELGEWQIFFEFVPLEECYARLSWQADEYIATVSFSSNTFRGSDARGFDPKRNARHEAAHLLFARLETIAKWRFIVPDMISAESERIARTLDKIL